MADSEPPQQPLQQKLPTASGTNPPTIGEIRASVALLPEADRWTILTSLLDNALLAPPKLGGELSRVPLATTVSRVDFKSLLALDVGIENFLSGRRSAVLAHLAQFGSVDVAPAVTTAPAIVSAAASPVAATTTLYEAQVDWRNRFGRSFLTTIQDQGGCECCWSFGAAALVETMVCIEHGMWSKRSEGDIRDGWGGEAGENWAVTDHITPCQKFNSVTGALDWIVKNGVADPDCYRYVGAPLRSHRGPRRPHHARR